MKTKTGIAQGIIMILVVIILLCGIFSIFRKMTGAEKASSANDNDGNGKVTEQAEETTQNVDNSVPMTSFTVTAEPSIREGQTMQLNIACEPENATNKNIKWTVSKENLVTISEDGVLTPAEGSAKNTVTVIGETTDGSALKQSFDLRIYPALDPSKPMVAITFDDGPYDKTTPTMLDAFEENYAKATFFCLGKMVNLYPDIVKREYELGMEVGTHTYSHDKRLDYLEAATLETEISDSIDANIAATGFAPRLVRPPYGAYNPDVLAAFKKHNMVGINWSLDTEDWKTKNADATYNEVMKAQDGDIILLHDIHSYNVNAVKKFVPDLIEKGYQLVTVSELYESFGEALDIGTIHYKPDPRTVETTEASDISVVDEETTVQDLD